MKSELATLADQYLNMLLKRNRHGAEALIIDALKSGTSIKEIYLKVFQPVQWKIGMLWQSNKISVAMEHFCTAVTQFIMSRLYDYIFSNDKNGYSLVATSVSGELHELGIRMVSDFFEMEGWNTYYLGASTTKDAILDMIKSVNADIIAISATIYFNIPQVEELIDHVRSNLDDDKVKIMVGGKAFLLNKSLWKSVNADVYATDAQDAINKANQIIKAW